MNNSGSKVDVLLEKKYQAVLNIHLTGGKKEMNAQNWWSLVWGRWSLIEIHQIRFVRSQLKPKIEFHSIGNYFINTTKMMEFPVE